MQLKLRPNCLAVFIDETGDELLSDPIQKVFGLAGCAVLATNLDSIVRNPWRDVRRIVAGTPDSQLHATDLQHPSPTQITAIVNFFREQPFARFGAVCSIETDLDKDITPLFSVAKCLGNRLVDILKWQPFASVEIIFEHSERLA